MVEIFGTVAPSQLLILMAIPLGGAVILAIIIVVSVSGRGKKAKMKHGISESKESEATMDPLSADQPVAPPAEEKQAAPLTPKGQATADELGLNMAILGGGAKKKETAIETKGAVGAQPTAGPAEPEELLRLLRDPQSGQLIVEVGGQRYKKLSDVADRGIGQFILKLVSHLLVFTSGVIVTEAGVKSLYTPKAGPVPEPLFPPVAPPAAVAPEPVTAPPAPIPQAEPAREASAEEESLIPKPSPEAEAAFLALQARSLVTGPEPPSISVAPPARGLFGRGRSSGSAPALPSLNLAGEINQIVQTRLMYSPLGAGNRIEVVSAPDGGIRIRVNGLAYNSPDEIPDDDIKTLVKESIKQWERL
jgi:hypothetical protein